MKRGWALSAAVCLVLALGVYAGPAAAALRCTPGTAPRWFTLTNGCQQYQVCSDDGYWEAGSCRDTTTKACTGCGGAGGTLRCDAACTPVGCNVGGEVCNNCDDNGDGQADNGVPPRACTNNCPTKGTQTCSAGQWSGCAGAGGTLGCTTGCGTAGTATCSSNGAASACSAPEVCNNCDDNADGLVDNNPGQGARTLSRACSEGCSVAGQQVCTNGTYGACFGCGGTKACASPCSASVGQVQCSAACAPAPGAACYSGPELCDGCDNDGNGIADDGKSCEPCSL